MAESASPKVTSKSDKNKKLTHAILKPAFDAFDLDNSGYIEIGELGKIFAFLGEEFDQKHVDEFMKENDTDQDQKLSFDEFVAMMKKLDS